MNYQPPPTTPPIAPRPSALRDQAARELNEEQRKADLSEMKVALKEERKAREVLDRINSKISKIETNAVTNAFY